MKEDHIIGSGAPWPITLTARENADGTTSNVVGWYPVSGDPQLVIQNLSTIIDTQVGFMLRNEHFGTRLYETIEEPNNRVLQFLVTKYLREAIIKYEPRVSVNSIKVTSEGGVLNIDISLTIGDITNNLKVEYLWQ